MTTALASLISNRPVRNDVAMTGEITLTGQVLPIGGLKEKSLAAQRAGIKQVIVPDRNEGDVEEISEQEREGLDFVYADDIGDVLKVALRIGWETPRAGSLPLHPGNDLRRPMGAQSRSAKAGDAARSVASNPYVRRLIEDDELRENIRVAFEAAKGAYARMSNGKGPAKALMDDKKVQRDLRTAAESLRDASQQLRGRSTRRRFGLGKALLVGILGAALVLILSEDARKLVLDKLFGAEEEFEYTSTTTPAPDTETVPSA